jgi:hypothetical protein
MTGTQILVLVLIAAAFATGWSARGRAERENAEATLEPEPGPAPEPEPEPEPVAEAPARGPELVALGDAVAAWDRARRDPGAMDAFAAAAAAVDAHAERLESDDYEAAANALAGLHHLLRDRRLSTPAGQAALARHQRALTDAYIRVAAR